MPENIRECLKASQLTNEKYNGKDDRKYIPNDIDWPDFARTMAEANGACPYGAYSSLIENKVPSDCRVYRWKPSDDPNFENNQDENNEDDDEEEDDSDYR